MLTSSKDRRARWLGGKAAAGESRELDAMFWAGATVEQKIDAMSQALADAALLKDDAAPARLQRHLGGVRKARG